MTKGMATALGIGFGCMLWSLLSTLGGFPTWMGFVGCTAYFVAGAGTSGAVKTLCSSVVGIFLAMMVITLYGTGVMQHETAALVLGALAVGVIAWMMTYLSKVNLLSNVPNTFMGCFATFAANGDWKTLLAGVVFGVLLGFVCDFSGRYLFQVAGKSEEGSEA